MGALRKGGFQNSPLLLFPIAGMRAWQISQVELANVKHFYVLVNVTGYLSVCVTLPMKSNIMQVPNILARLMYCWYCWTAAVFQLHTVVLLCIARIQNGVALGWLFSPHMKGTSVTNGMI
uniref:Uncharacterized protein n=1 Tax=Sphaerodactylus townsendi TaxID=933632 RepID=A0ACB8FQ78_9SAUR